MPRRIPVQVHFDGQRRPVALSRRRSTHGQRVIIEIEETQSPSAFVLFRSDNGDLVLAASPRRDPVEAARRRLGALAEKYSIADVPLY
jgi:hypothetical protein